MATAQAETAHVLYERYYRGVYRYALSQLRSPQDAEDAAQNTFLRAFAALQKGVLPENESAWLFKIAHNVCASSKLAWLRRRRVEAPRDLDALPVEPAARETRRDELAGLEDALAAMPPRLREAFLLREWQGLSYDEIAERLDTSRSAVETLIFRARRMLARQLESPWQRLREALALGPLLNAARGLLEGTPALVKAAGAVAVVAGAGAAAEPLLTTQPQRPAPAAPHRQAPVRVAPVPPPKPHPARRRETQHRAVTVAHAAAATTLAAAVAAAPGVAATGPSPPSPPAATLPEQTITTPPPPPASPVDLPATLPDLPRLPDLPTLPAATLPVELPAAPAGSP